MLNIHLDSIKSIIDRLPKSGECEWVEHKVSYKNHNDIGEYISALSNSATLHGVPFGYIIWGIDDYNNDLFGTVFKPRSYKVGNEELENWLSHLLEPRIDFKIYEGTINNQFISLIEIPAAANVPTRFQGIEYIRIGTYKKKLKEHPEKEKALWQIFSNQKFEEGLAKQNVSSDAVLKLLDYPSFFDMLNKALPAQPTGILARLEREKFIIKRNNNSYDITNLGAILYAKDISEFTYLARKALRIIVYDGTSKIKTIREQTVIKGYAVGFEGAISFINTQLPQNEKIVSALRKEVHLYPEVAIRELAANALIHQDFTITGTGPVVEIFTDRIEITNPGTPLIDTQRFIDEPPQSRNEALAAFMRRINICEERGSGIDKVIFNVELFQLPAPDFRKTANHTITILYAPKPYKKMSKEERIRACYQHSCLCYVSNKDMTNSSLRERFNISSDNYSMVSRIIKDSIDAEVIKLKDPSIKSPKHIKYVPFWY